MSSSSQWFFLAPNDFVDVGINGSQTTMDVPSSGGSNNSDGLLKQSETELLPNFQNPPTKKHPKRRHEYPKPLFLLQ